MNAILKDSLEWLGSVKKPLDKQGILDAIPSVKGWVEEEINEFEEAVKLNDREGMKNAIVDAIWIVNNLAFFAGLTLEELNEEGILVAKSNFTKFCKTEEEAIQSVQMYAEGTHPNKLGMKVDTTYIPTGNPEYPYYITKTDGKIFKSYRFKDVDELRKTLTPFDGE